MIPPRLIIYLPSRANSRVLFDVRTSFQARFSLKATYLIHMSGKSICHPAFVTRNAPNNPSLSSFSSSSSRSNMMRHIMITNWVRHFKSIRFFDCSFRVMRGPHQSDPTNRSARIIDPQCKSNATTIHLLHACIEWSSSADGWMSECTGTYTFDWANCFPTHLHFWVDFARATHSTTERGW